MPDTFSLRLLCRAATRADKQGRFAVADEPSGELNAHPDIRLHAHEQLMCAPEPRAYAIAQRLWPSHSVRQVAALAECEMGCWAGRALKDLPAAALADWLSNPEAAPHGGESLLELKDRVGQWMDGLIHAPEGSSRLLAVTHASVIRAAIGHALDCPSHVTGRMDIEPLALVTLTYHRQWKVRIKA